MFDLVASGKPHVLPSGVENVDLGLAHGKVVRSHRAAWPRWRPSWPGYTI